MPWQRSSHCCSSFCHLYWPQVFSCVEHTSLSSCRLLGSHGLATRNVDSHLGMGGCRRDRYGNHRRTRKEGDGRRKRQMDAEARSMPAGGPHELFVSAENKVTIKDVLVGEVWICSGQSNMQWSVRQSWNQDLATASAKYPNIRLMTINTAGCKNLLRSFG